LLLRVAVRETEQPSKSFLLAESLVADPGGMNFERSLVRAFGTQRLSIRRQ